MISVSNLDSEHSWQLGSFVAVAVERVGDKSNWDARLTASVEKSLETSDGPRDRDCSARQHAVDVETDAERRLQTNRWDVFANPLMGRTNYSATLVHWSLMGGELHLVQRGGDWSGPQPAQAHPRCTKCNTPPINNQCTYYRISATTYIFGQRIGPDWRPQHQTV